MTADASPAARALATARHLARLTQAQLAHRAGTSSAAVSAIESGRRDPTVDTLARLIAAAGQGLHLAVTSPDAVHDEAAVGRALLRVLNRSEQTGLSPAQVAPMLADDVPSCLVARALTGPVPRHAVPADSTTDTKPNGPCDG